MNTVEWFLAIISCFLALYPMILTIIGWMSWRYFKSKLRNETQEYCRDIIEEDLKDFKKQIDNLTSLVNKDDNKKI